MKNQGIGESLGDLCVFLAVKSFKWLIWVPLVKLPLGLWTILLRIIEGKGYKRILAVVFTFILIAAAAYFAVVYEYISFDLIHPWQGKQVFLKKSLLAWMRKESINLKFLLDMLTHSIMSFAVLSPIYIFYAKERLDSEKMPFNIYSEKLRSEHCLVLGATGSGKTTTVIERFMKGDIESGRGLFFMTAKEEQGLLDRVLSYATDCGRAKDLQIFTLSNFPQSQIYNPLSSQDAMELRDMLFYSFEWDNPYYREQSKSALLNVISALTEIGKSFSLMDLYYLFTDKNAMERLASEVTNDHSRYHLDRYIQDWKVFTKNIHGLVANLEDYTNKRICSRLSNEQSDIDIMEAYRQNKIVIFILNSLQYGESAKCLGKMVLQNLRVLAGNIAASREGQFKFFPVYVDEFHHFIYPQFFSMIAQCRSSNIGLMLSTQSFSDLKNDDMDIVTQVIQNTNTKIILRQNDADSAELVAKLAGTKTVDFHTVQYENTLTWGEQATGMGTVKQEEEFVIHPNVIKKMCTGEAVVIVKGVTRLVQFDFLPKIENLYSWENWFVEHGTRNRKNVGLESASIFSEIQKRIGEKKKKGIIRKIARNPKKDDLNNISGIDLIKKVSGLESDKNK